MKKSVICILGIIFIMGLATAVTSLAFAIESPQAGHKSALKQLPSTIKIDPNVINAQKYNISNKKFSEFKQKWILVTDGVAAVNALIPGLEQLAASVKQKEVECINKQYTTADITAACHPTHTIAECSTVLFIKCTEPAVDALLDHLDTLEDKIGMAASVVTLGNGVAPDSNAARHILGAWWKELANSQIVPH